MKTQDKKNKQYLVKYSIFAEANRWLIANRTFKLKWRKFNLGFSLTNTELHQFFYIRLESWVMGKINSCNAFFKGKLMSPTWQRHDLITTNGPWVNVLCTEKLWGMRILRSTWNSWACENRGARENFEAILKPALHPSTRHVQRAQIGKVHQ